ncbi:hypothetical protein B0I37DRAFT_175464 [Chaetomium sp. MPI-CAGE-AT-0009]|nr:hypothetical protein B0I37DRAFT_175464 [Chaetomium sp. MPI-CAGE-AT-0009]
MSLQRVKPVAANLRTILVKVSPSPSTLSERRAVLGALKKYAEVDVFKKLQDPSYFVSVVAQPQMADNLIAKSPLQFDVATRQEHHHSNNKPITTTTTTTTDTPTPSPTPQPTQTFLVKITSKPDYNHKTHIREALTYGRWPEQGQEHAQALFLADSVARVALADAVPPGIARAGLADWESAGQLDGDDGGVATWLSNRGDFATARRMRKERVQSGFESLVGLFEGRHGHGAKKEGGGEDRRDGGFRPALDGTGTGTGERRRDALRHTRLVVPLYRTPPSALPSGPITGARIDRSLPDDA